MRQPYARIINVESINHEQERGPSIMTVGVLAAIHCALVANLIFRRVTEIDVTGARILQQATREVSAKHCQLVFASANPDGARGWAT